MRMLALKFLLGCILFVGLLGCSGEDASDFASCDDGEISGAETDVDCGGSTCDPCGLGLLCEKDSDCESSICHDGRCVDQVPVCGNDIIEEGETCDGDCPTSCEDADSCTTDSLTGSAADCDVVCVNEIITTCINDDGCCPGACDVDSDNDCVELCHDVVGGGVTVAAMAERTGHFEIVWDVTPEVDHVDAVVALSYGIPGDQEWSALATSVMFGQNDGNSIIGRNGDVYEADISVSYLPGETYRVRQVVDLPNHSYSIYVTAPRGDEQLVAEDFAFRNGQESVSSLDHMVLMSGIGPMRACLISLNQVETTVRIITEVLPKGHVNEAYSTTLQAGDGVAPYTWSLESGALPAGLTLHATGVIDGIPTTLGVSSFVVRAQDSESTWAIKEFSLEVSNAGLIADFSATPLSGQAPLTIQFADQSMGDGIYRWAWDLGDGTASAAQHPERTYYTPGEYTVTLEVFNREESALESKTAYITITGYAGPPVHVDPTNTGDLAEDGSLAHPYDSWGDVTWAEGGMYLQKRGTTANERLRLTSFGGTEHSHLVIGAYGEGAVPVLDGTGLGDTKGVQIGLWHAGPVLGYIDINDFEVRNFENIGIFTSTHDEHSPHHCVFNNLHVHHNGSSDHRVPGMYLYHTSGNGSDPLYNKIVNCHAEYNEAHGYKVSSGYSLVDNCTTNDNGGHGISCPEESRYISIVGGTHRDNGSSGVELGGEGSSAMNVICHGNRFGILINEYGHKIVKRSDCYDNEYGLLVSCALEGVLSDVLVEETRIHDNVGPGVRLKNGCADVLIRKTEIYNNADYGVVFYKDSSYTGTPFTNIEFQYNLIYDNSVGILVHHADGVTVLNNTFYANANDDVSVSSSGSNVLIRNSVLSSVSGDSSEDHNIFYPGQDPHFVDSGDQDFHLQSTSPCIDSGVDVGLSEDFEGNSVPVGGVPDVGAFEYSE